MSSPASGSTKFPFSPLPESVDAYMAEQGMLSVSEQHINDYRRRYEYLHPDEDSPILQRHIQSVHLLLGWDKDNNPVKARPTAVADLKIPEGSITLGSHRRRYTAYKEFYDQMVWNARLGVYNARLFAYHQLATSNFKFQLPADVLPAFNAWKQGDFHTEILKLVPLSRSVPYSPLYEVAVDELATAITQKVEGGEAIARTWKAFATASTTQKNLTPSTPKKKYPNNNVPNPNNQTPPLRVPHHHNIHALPPHPLEPVYPARDDNSRGNASAEQSPLRSLQRQQQQ
ncbi:uncharacterized protein BO87DRAFT_460674 [Aspergillus neoniger CBS 115656]|uniref:Uncharacterized protein n=1 Tax=Aspergillus neoniger (strain CBS 115656) TaxID=1448310 RepID=A0A318YDB2_ASPNB|nr:hypothetical protein BO87DRAFT_460674 [Aspergillus neoniger CBS 115656]PYH32415.1 hypothetical protein BO87DRAFT_460674 [Aspergillus neoniger CBS 115656]